MSKLYGKEPISFEEYARRYTGVRMTNVMADYMPELDPDATQEAKNYWSRHYVDNLSRVELKPNVIDTLDYLRDNGFVMAIATNMRESTMNEVLKTIGERHHGFSSYFSFKGSASMVGKSKPAPDLLYYVCENIGVVPSKSIFVEDSVVGVQSGTAAGTYTIGYSNEAENRERLRNAGADELISELSELEFIVMGTLLE